MYQRTVVLGKKRGFVRIGRPFSRDKVTEHDDERRAKLFGRGTMKPSTQSSMKDGEESKTH